MEIIPTVLKDKFEQGQEQNQKQEYKFIGSIQIRRGMKLFCYDSGKDQMKEVKISKQAAADLSGSIIENKQAQHDPKLIYFQSINERNARRKLRRFKAGDWNVAENFKKKNSEPLPQIF